MDITVFQALTMLIANKKCAFDSERILQKIYLRGVTTSDDALILREALNSLKLTEFTINEDVDSINNDPTRRYFESMLALHTLKENLDDLDIQKLKQLYQFHFHKMSPYFQLYVPETVFKNQNLHKVAGRDLSEEKYAKSLATLEDENSYVFLFPKELEKGQAKLILNLRKEKLILLSKIAFCAVVSVQLNNEAFPLDLYTDPNGPFGAKQRGRKLISDPVNNFFQQTTHSSNLGIMKSNMPLYRDSPLLSQKNEGFVRPVDVRKLDKSSIQARYIESKKVLPFVNGISGTFLMVLRLAKQLRDEGVYPYENSPMQLRLFIKTLVAILIHTGGGHSTQEWLQPIQLPEIQDAFKTLAGFDAFSMENLYMSDRAFFNAREETELYTKSYLRHQAINQVVVHRALSF